jgi:hypothetical protein
MKARRPARGNQKTPVIKKRAETPRAETVRTPVAASAPTPLQPTGAPQAAAEKRVGELRERLWALCSPLAPAAYDTPWDGIAADLAGRLSTALATPGAYAAAAAASHLSYAECAKTLIRGAPTVHRALTDIRGLALAAAPELVAAKKSAAIVAEAPPGDLLVYDILVF